MRNLIMSDVFKMSKILKKMNLKMEFDDKSQEQTGGELVMKIMENLGSVENEINDFMGDLLGITAEEFANMPVVESLKIFGEFLALEGVSDFLKSVNKSTTLE